ncbi:unnamed protein product [Brassica rapa subsp. narinosa]
MDLREAMRKQNDVAVNLSMNVLSSATKDSNVIFSPASINSAITMHAAGPGGESIASEILSFLRSSSIEELKTIFRDISSPSSLPIRVQVAAQRSRLRMAYGLKNHFRLIPNSRISSKTSSTPCMLQLISDQR